MASEKQLLILGANSDIATAAAERFAREGWHLILASRNRERTETLCRRLSERYHITASRIHFDALETASFLREYGKLESRARGVLMAHALPEPGDEPEVQKSPELSAERRVSACQSVIQTNFTSVVEVLETLKHDPVLRNDGFICAISSVAGLRGRASNTIYGSSKAALNSYMSGLRNELAGKVHVMTVLPGFADTKMLKKSTPKVLTASPSRVADAMYRGIMRRREIIYVKKIWYPIMLVIRLIPEKLFKRMKL